MEWIIQVLAHTPWRVLCFLVSRVLLRAESGPRFALSTLVLVPALLTGWGFCDLMLRHWLDVLTLAPWLLALAIQAAIGLAILRRAPITGASRPASSSIGRPTTPLPPIFLAFAVKYSFVSLPRHRPICFWVLTGFRLADSWRLRPVRGRFRRQIRALLAGLQKRLRRASIGVGVVALPAGDPFLAQTLPLPREEIIDDRAVAHPVGAKIAQSLAQFALVSRRQAEWPFFTPADPSGLPEQPLGSGNPCRSVEQPTRAQCRRRNCLGRKSQNHT